MTMRKINTKTSYFIVEIIILILIISSPLWIWQIKSEKIVDILIIDKTVPDESYREHKGLMWLLNQQKYIQSDGTHYDMREDYVGFVPLSNKEYKVREIPENLGEYQLIYIADGYGVYEEEFFGENQIGERSSQIYGGMTSEDVSKIKHSVIKNRTTLIAEFNTFASPTPDSVKQEFYQVLNINWTGWIGRFFIDLSSSEVPIWVRENYEKQTNNNYDFSGSGYVFVDEQDKVVILDKNDTNGKGAKFTLTNEGQAYFQEGMNVEYNYWFDIIEPINSDEVLATYSLGVDEQAIKKLNENGIPDQFPAVIHHKNDRYQSFYFAGDYADQAELPGLYQTTGFTTWKKWFTPNTPNNTMAFYWKAYVPMMSKIMQNLQPQSTQEVSKEEMFVEDRIKVVGQASQDYLQIYRNKEWEDFLVKGVNMGMAKPGAWPGEASITKSEYARWFKQIGEMNANAIRIYTIHPPAFYEALYDYNQTAKEPIYLFHGVWINEEELVSSGDTFNKALTEEFKQEINMAVDVIHGNITIPKKAGHSSGTYTRDVSNYVLGWILGIEWAPETVNSTNLKHQDASEYTGKYIQTKNASAFEKWLANLMDETIAYETINYNTQRPMSFTNWPTTDLIEHPSEKDQNEDKVGVNPNVIIKTDSFKSDLFASYHVYPYYPDFLNTEDQYINYQDHEGENNNYAGYLNHLRDVHEMPVLIAEFGVPASRGLTHKNVHGMDQGELSEEEQGTINSKLFKSIVDEHMAGGIVFTWQDEWFKRTWNTMDYDNPNRRAYWSNAQTNEQQFGLLSFDPSDSYESMIKVDGQLEDWQDIYPTYSGDNLLNNLSVTHDARYLYFLLQYEQEFDSDYYKSTILLDTIESQGQTKIPGIPKFNTKGIDFIINLNGKERSEVLIDSYYDTFYFDYSYKMNLLKSQPYVTQKNNGVFHPIRLALLRNPFEYYETGQLLHGNGNPKDEEYNSLTDFSINEESKIIELRIPWGLINVKDPSQREVMGDIWSSKGIESSDWISGIKIGAVITDKEEDMVHSYPEHIEGYIPSTQYAEYKWDSWDEPTYHERLKQSYYIFQELYHNYER
ncbi:hypothetical protein [Litchfieldia alkalitelluris]|uniref:hypothetical protein n=1 Tax=Litchfieldia alkalitelluris TaxID=304268 RepID=UPI002E25C097